MRPQYVLVMESTAERRARRIKALYERGNLDDTVVMSREELDAILAVDSALADRHAVHERATVSAMPAVSVR